LKCIVTHDGMRQKISHGHLLLKTSKYTVILLSIKIEELTKWRRRISTQRLIQNHRGQKIASIGLMPSNEQTTCNFQCGKIRSTSKIKMWGWWKPTKWKGRHNISPNCSKLVDVFTRTTVTYRTLDRPVGRLDSHPLF
jgi:hypothetical protein